MACVEGVLHKEPIIDSGIGEEARRLERTLDVGAQAVASSTEGKAVSVEETEKMPTVAELLEKHEYGEFIEEKFTKAILFFGKAEEEDKLKTGFDSDEGPTVGLAPASGGMIRLEQKNKISEKRRKEGRATISQLTFSSLFMEDSPAVRAQNEDSTLELLEALEREYIAARLATKG
jgi:hypothetical protein